MKKRYAKFMIVYFYGGFKLEWFCFFKYLGCIGLLAKNYWQARIGLRKNFYRMISVEYGMTERDIKGK